MMKQRRQDLDKTKTGERSSNGDHCVNFYHFKKFSITHKIKSFFVLEILTTQLSILSLIKTSYSAFASETNALFIHNYLILLPLSGILHSNILAIFLLYCSRGTQYARRELTLESRSNCDASRLVGSQMTCSVFFWNSNAASRNITKS